MKLWRVTMRRLTAVRSESKLYMKYIVLPEAITSEKDAVAYIKTHKFSAQWWDEMLLVDIEFLEDVWYCAK
jgi:hypothetical protein